jgi:hypothetical protein
MVTSAILYGFFAIWMLRSDRRTLWAWDGAAFVIYSMIEPYAVKSGLISLAPAALTAGCLFALRRKHQGRSSSGAIRWANRLFLAACGLSFLQAILQYKPWQRYLLSFGMDFWGECLLLGAFAIWIGRTHLPQALGAQESGQTTDASHHATGVLGLAPKREKLPALARSTQFAIENSI